MELLISLVGSKVSATCVDYLKNIISINLCVYELLRLLTFK